MNIMKITCSNNQIMDNSLGINYSAKQQAMHEASEVIKHSLKTIADSFKNFHDEYLSLLEDNKRLQLSVEELQKKKDEYGVCGKDQTPRGNVRSNVSKFVTEEVIVDTIRPEETQGIIENTQIGKRESSKSKCRHLDKRSNLPINILDKSINDHSKNKTSNPGILVNTQSKKKKRPNNVKISLDISLTSSKTSQEKKISQPVVKNTDVNINENKNIVDADAEYLDIDATLFEPPFSQEDSVDLIPQKFCESDEIEIVEHNLKEVPRQISAQDDIVETSPNKNLLRKKHWTRHNKINVSADDSIDKDSLTPKSSKYLTPRETDEKKSTDVNKNETISRTPNRKINIFSQRPINQKESEILANDSTFFSAADLSTTPEIINPKSSVKTTEKNKSDIDSAKILIQSCSTEKATDETYFAGDETYFPGHEASVSKNKSNSPEGIINKAKRKFADFARGSSIESKTNLTPVMDLDIEMSDWELDSSGDKWVSIPPPKRLLVESKNIDVVPTEKQAAPIIATKGPVVRNKLARAKLNGWDCENCENYYKNMGLKEEELRERKNLCSRHRSKFNERYYTPPGLWDLRFPDTQSSSQE